MLMDIPKQAIAKNWQVEFKRQAEEQKQQEVPWDFTHRRVLNFHLHNVPVILDLTDKRKWIAFQVHPVNWWLLLFQLCKMPFEQFY